MAGEALIKQLALLTGLPQEQISAELIQLVQAQGIDTETVSIEDLRMILAEYLQDTLVAAKWQLTTNFTE
jgi:hypothetical protein